MSDSTLDFSRAIPIDMGEPPVANALHQSMAYAVAQDPDKHALLLRLQLQTGVGPETSKQNLDQVQQSADVNSIDYGQFSKDNPRTTGWASNPDNAAVSGVAEIQRLAQIEQQANTGSRLSKLSPSQQQAVIEDRKRMFLQHYELNHGTPAGKLMAEQGSIDAGTVLGAYGLVKSPADLAGSWYETLGKSGEFFKALSQTPKAILDSLSLGNLDLGDNLAPSGPTLGEKLSEIWGPVGTGRPAISKYTDAVQNFLAKPVLSAPSQTLKDPKTGEPFENPDYAWWGRGLANAFAEAPGVLAATTATEGLGAGELLPSLFGVGSYQRGYEEAKAAGADEKTALHSAIGQGVSSFALTGLVPQFAPASTYTGAIAQWGLRSAALGGTMTAAENYFARDYDPQRPLFEGWQQSMATMAAYEGTGAMHHILDIAGESQLKARSQEKFREAIAASVEGTPSENVRVPLDQWNEYWQQQKMNPAKVAEQLGISKAYVEARLGAGGNDVVVPTADFVSQLDDKHIQGLKPDIRGYDHFGNPTQTPRELLEQETPEGLARREQSIADVAVRMHQADAETQASPDYLDIKERLRQQKIAAGDSAEVAETNAAVEANVYMNLARSEGLTPQETFAIHKPNVVVGEAPGRVLYQSAGQPVKSLSELAGNMDEAERRYDELGQSNYISGDRVKELLQGWGDKANRPELEESEHANASKIAYELFYRKAARLPEGSSIHLVTGPVAAGKTTAIGARDGLTYEVNLSNKEKAFEHLDRLLDMGLKPTVNYVYTTPELSAERRASRAQADGRTVRIDRSTAQHLELPASIQAIADHYGDRVAINTYDTSVHPTRTVPVSELGTLAYNGTREDLLDQQQRHLDSLRDSGAISPELHYQISRRPPETRGRVGAGGAGKPEQGRGAEGRREEQDLAQGDTLYQTAFHGSPYHFDRFTLSHIGSGEGAQSYGHGLYFAGDRAVAEYYRDKLAPRVLVDGKPLDKMKAGFAESSMANMFENRKAAGLDDEQARQQTAQWAKSRQSQVSEEMTPEQIDGFVNRLSEGKGQLYEVDLPEHHQMLDWDKPVSQQPEEVKASLEQIHKSLMSSDPEMLTEYLDRMNADWDELTGKDLYTILKRASQDDVLRGKDGQPFPDEHPVGDAQLRGQDDEAASKFLKEFGLEGIKYLDQGSRAAGAGSHNYVVFDDQAVRILETYYQGQRAAGGPRGWSRVRPDGTIEIGRTGTADLSTDPHEFGHAYLPVISKLAKREGASEQLKSDHQKILKFLGATDLENLTREQHEKWADARLQYLRTGKAPSASLRPAFQRMAIWIKNIYKRAEELGVKLDPEIHGVMDRLHAAEEGVNKARAEAGPRMFQSADETGMTEEQFKRYADDHQVSVEQAKEHILAQLNEARLRERTEDWRAEEKNVRTAVTEQLDQQPEYAAIRQLRRAALDDGTELKMNKESLVKQFGAARVKALQKQHPGLYRNEGGTDPETAAEIFGFSSAEEMLKAIEGAPSRNDAIEQQTRDYMTQKHGDIRYDGTLDDQARIALENDKKSQATYQELQALHKKVADMQAAGAKDKAARQAIEIAPMKSYQEFAQKTVESKAPSELQPARYLDASRKYSRESFEAMRRGDYQKAEEAKHMELVNHYLFREAVKAQQYLEKFESNMAKWQRKPVQSSLGLAGEDHQEQFNYLMGRYGAAPRTSAPERSLADWAQSQYDLGKDAVIDPALFNEGRVVNYRNVPISEIRLVHDALKNIKTLAYKELNMVIAGRAINFEKAINEMIDRARSTGKSTPVRVLKRNTTTGEQAIDLIQRGDALLTRTEFLMHDLDGGTSGPFHDYLWNLAADAQGREHALQAQTTKLVGEAIQNMTPEERRSRLEKVTIPGIKETVTRHDLISWVFNMGNEGNLDRLRKTFVATGWDPSVIPTLPGLLRPNELQFIQDAAKSLIPLGKEQFELERRQTGLSPVMVEPRPFTTTTADGTEMRLDGWYYPIQMDPRYSVRGALQDVGVTAGNLMEAGYGRAATSRGAMKQRTGFGGALDMDYEQVLTQHIAKVVKDITHREFMLAANKILTDPRIRDVLRERLGEGYEEKMMPWLRTIINDRNGSAVQGIGDVAKVMRVLRTNVVKAALTFKASTLILQVTHASSIFRHTTPAAYSQSMIQFLAHPLEMTEQIRNLSPNEMMFRGENIDRDYRAMLQDKSYKQGLAASYSRGADTAAVAGMYPVMLTDHLLSFPLWHAVYQQGLSENVHLPESEAQYQAMHKADSAVRMALGSNAPKDLPPIMRNDPYLKLITTLGGFHNLKYNQIRAVGKEFGRAQRAGQTGRGVLNATYGMLMASIIPAVLGSWITGRGPKEDENPGLWAAKKALLFPAETIPLLGNLVEAWDRGGDVSFTPLAQLASRAVKNVQRLSADREDKDWTGMGMDTLQTAMEAFGVPGTDQAFKTARYIRKWSNDEIENPNVWDAVMGGHH